MAKHTPPASSPSSTTPGPASANAPSPTSKPAWTPASSSSWSTSARRASTPRDTCPARGTSAKGVIERDIETAIPDPATPIVLYCGGGFRSALAADALQKMGYTNVISMDGGWRVWNEQGYPTE